MAVINGNFTGESYTRVYPLVEYSYTQSIAGNYSDVTVTLKFKSVSAYYGYGISSSTTTKAGSSYNHGSVAFNVPAGGTDTIASHTFRVYHNADGTKSVSIGASGSTDIYWGSYNFSQVVALTTIPREAYVTNSVSFTLGNDIPLTLSNAGNQYVQSLLYIGATLIKTTNHGQVTSATIEPDATDVNNMYAEIPNSTSSAMTVKIRTYSDSGYSTQIGDDKDKTGTMSIDQATNKPTFTTYTLENVDKTVDNTDSYGNVLVSSSTSTLLGTSSDKMIKTISKIRAVVTTANKMTALNYATEDKYRFATALQYKEEDYSDVATVNLDIDNALTGNVSVTAYDSRSLTTTVNGAFSYQADYEDVALWGLTLVRDNSIDEAVTLSVSGSYFNEYFGGGTSGVQNTFTAHYRYKETSVASWTTETWNAITMTDTSGSLSFSDYINGDLGASGFDTEKSYDIEVRLYDKLTNIIISGVLDRGIPVMDITQDGIAIGGKFDPDILGALQIGSLDGESAIIQANDPANTDSKLKLYTKYADASVLAMQLNEQGGIDPASTMVADEDDMASNSSYRVPTQQSVKAYVDTALSTGLHKARAYLSSDVTLAHATEAKIQLNSQSYDISNLYNGGTKRFEIQQDGFYLVVCSLGPANISATIFQVQIRVNGASMNRNIRQYSGATNQGTAVAQAVEILRLSAGDYVEMYGYHNTGSSITISSTVWRTNMMVHQLSND